ncbi:hypothetical protein IQ07DRAFT_604328 [Pyrenochaeta sp. DS3sAY3a]|nr:hypothetical protein IQ07DRAFT_604328 [Pyrenochaeta sp. DS3sAY3a]
MAAAQTVPRDDVDQVRPETTTRIQDITRGRGDVTVDITGDDWEDLEDQRPLQGRKRHRATTADLVSSSNQRLAPPPKPVKTVKMSLEDYGNKGSLSNRRPTTNTSPFVSGSQPRVSLRDSTKVVDQRVIPSKLDTSGNCIAEPSTTPTTTAVDEESSESNQEELELRKRIRGMLASIPYINNGRLTIKSQGVKLKADVEKRSVQVMGLVKLKLGPDISTHSDLYMRGLIDDGILQTVEQGHGPMSGFRVNVKISALDKWAKENGIGDVLERLIVLTDKLSREYKKIWRSMECMECGMSSRLIGERKDV